MDLTVRGLVTIDGSGAVAGSAVASAAFDKITEAQRRAAQGARDLQSGTAAAQDQFSKTQSQANSFAGVKLGSNDTQDLIKYGAALDGLRASYDPLFAASRRYEEMLQQLDAIERSQPALISEVTAERERLRVSFENSVVASGNATKAYNGTSGSLANLSFQINDIASGIAMGQSPFQILAQQGGQVFQVWQMNNNVFKDAAGLLVKIATPANLAVAALVGVGVGLTAIYASSISAGKELDSSLLGTGRNAGVTASQLDAMAHSAAASSEIGIGAARGYAEAFAASGKVSGQSIGDLTGLVQDYARLTREDAGDASKELVSDFSDLSRGAAALDDKLGFLDDKTKQVILTLERQGDHNQAVAVTIEALKGSIDHSRDNLTWFQRVWDDISNAAGRAADNISRAASPNLDDRIATARQRAAMPTGANPDPDVAPSFDDLPTLLQQQGQETFKQVQTWLNDQARASAKSAGDIARAGTPNFSQLQGLQSQQKILGDTLNNPAAVAGMSPATVQQTALAYSAITNNIKSLTDANGDLIPQIDVQNQQFEIARQAITAVGPAQKGYIAAEQERLSLIGQSISPGEASARIENARALAIAQASHELDIQNRTTQIAIAGSIALADAYAKGGDGALEAQAHSQALAESLTNGANVDARARQLLTQAVGSQTASMAQNQLQQERTNDATSKGNALVLSGALSYGRLSDYVQQNVEMLQLEDLRKSAVSIPNNEKLITQIDAMIAKYPALAQKRHEADAVNDIQNSLSSLSDNAPAAAQASRYALAVQQASVWRTQTLDDIKDVGAAHDQLANDVETIFDDRLGQLYEDDLRRRRDWSAGIARANLDITRSHEDMATKSEAFIRGWDQDSEQAFVNLATTGKAQIGDLVTFVEQQFARMAYEKSLAGPINDIGSSLLDFAASAFGVGGYTPPGFTSIPDLSPGIPTPRLSGARAGGGSVRRGDTYLVGEDGPELFKADADGTIVSNSNLVSASRSGAVEAAQSQPQIYMLPAANGGSGAAPNISISIINNSSTALSGTQGQTRSDGQGGFSIDMLVNEIEQHVASNIKNGNSPIAQQLEQSHNVRRTPG